MYNISRYTYKSRFIREIDHEHLVEQYICLSFVYEHTDVASVLPKPVVDKLHDAKILLTKKMISLSYLVYILFAAPHSCTLLYSLGKVDSQIYFR